MSSFNVLKRISSKKNWLEEQRGGGGGGGGHFLQRDFNTCGIGQWPKSIKHVLKSRCKKCPSPPPPPPVVPLVSSFYYSDYFLAASELSLIYWTGS